MGLAERFKEQLGNRDIFEKTNNKFISKPITQDITIQPKAVHSLPIEPVENLSDLQVSSDEYKYCQKYENLETEIIDKIRKTPYWKEYSKFRQRQMIEAYFIKKNKKSFSINEKNDFINNILSLV